MKRNFYRCPDTGECFEYTSDEISGGWVKPYLVPMSDEEVKEHLADPVLTNDQIAAIALSERDRLLEFATLRISPLQDAVDLGEASAEEEQSLLAWKRYRVAVNRVSQQAGFPAAIDWPTLPK